jgi:hypothetical protein
MGNIERIMVLPVSTKDFGIALSIFSVFPAFKRSTIEMWTEIEGAITWLKIVLVSSFGSYD